MAVEQLSIVELTKLMGGSIPQMRKLSPLPEHVQREIDDVILRVGTERLTVVRDVMAAGLVKKHDPYKSATFDWTEQSEHGRAKNQWSPGSIVDDHQPDMRPESIPIVCQVDRFTLDARLLGISQNAGTDLDLEGLEQATRNVNQLSENNMINGIDFVMSTPTGTTSKSFGLTTHPDRNKIAFAGNKEWTDLTHVGNDKLNDLVDMIQLNDDALHFGQVGVWLPGNYGTTLSRQFNTAGGGDTRLVGQVLREIERVDFISVADFLPASRIVMAEMEARTIRVIDGQRPTAITWMHPNQQTMTSLVVSFLNPNPRSNYELKSGIVTGSPAGGL